MSRRTHTLVFAGLAALATVSLTACGSLDGSAHAVAPAASTATATTTPSATPSATPAPVVAAPAGTAPAGTASGGTGRGTGTGGSSTGGETGAGGGTGSGPGTGGSGTGGSGGGGTGGSGGGGGTSAPAPKITGFKVKQQPTCPVHGTPDAPFSAPGTDVVIAWTVTGADGAAIAVDNPGTYGAYGSDYPASGELSLPFGCNDGTTTTHTYTVWPAGAHSVSKTLSVSAHSDN